MVVSSAIGVSSSVLFGALPGAVGAQVGRIAADAHVVPGAAVVAGAVEERGRAPRVAADLQAAPRVGGLGLCDRDQSERGQGPPAGATGFRPDPAVRTEAENHPGLVFRPGL